MPADVPLAVWRHGAPTRLLYVVCAAVPVGLGALLVVDGATTGDRVAGVLVALGLAPLMVAAAFRPFLALHGDRLVVQNVFRRHEVRRSDVGGAAPSAYGVVIVVRALDPSARHGGRRVVAAAVPEAPITRLLGLRSRSADVAAELDRWAEPRG